MMGIVIGLGKQSSVESTSPYFTGDECIAELIEPLTPNSENWYVQFPKDYDEHGIPRQRIRRLVRRLP